MDLDFDLIAVADADADADDADAGLTDSYAPAFAVAHLQLGWGRGYVRRIGQCNADDRGSSGQPTAWTLALQSAAVQGVEWSGPMAED